MKSGKQDEGGLLQRRQEVREQEQIKEETKKRNGKT